MWVYIKSTGIALSRYTNGLADIIICDPGGRRSEMKKWGKFVHEVATTVLYFVDAGCYDQVVAEDHSINRLAEELKLFTSLCNSHTQVNVVLFMHKMDKLERKLESIPFDSSLIGCPNAFNGNPHSIEDVKAYLLDAFLTIARKADRNVTVKFTSLQDKEELGRLALSYSLPRSAPRRRPFSNLILPWV